MESTKIEKKLVEYWHKRGTSENARKYLGASIVGHECDRYLWLYFRGAFREDFDGRMYRLFDRGRREEATFTQELRGIGVRVWDCDPMTRQQWAVSGFGGLFAGHLDGMAQGVPGLPPEEVVVVEYKTHSDSSFKKLKKDGVQTAKPMHFAQMQTYMGTEKKLHALYLAVDKNTDEVYAEIVDFNKNIFENILMRAYKIITSEEPLDRCATRPDDWRCKYCAAYDVCWGKADRACAICPAVDCRSCKWAAANTEKGCWECMRDLVVSIGKPTICKLHVLRPGLMNPDIKPEGYDSASDCMMYSYKGSPFENGGPDGFSSQTLCSLSPDECIDKDLAGAVKEIKGTLNAPDVKSVPAGPLLDRFPKSNCNLLWYGSAAEWMNHLSEASEISDSEVNVKTGVQYYEFDGDKLVCISNELGKAYILGRKGSGAVVC